ncbi:MAG: hypothetical protein RMJ97_08180 [Raineya sp.]|nr:hypothetical protein [Raineya sp.]MDW8296848.1 hypothetical protein [Raineya sp.]
MKNIRLFIGFVVAIGGLLLIASQKRVLEKSHEKSVAPVMGLASNVPSAGISAASNASDNYSEDLKDFLSGFTPARFPFVIDEKTMSFLKMQEQPDWKKVKKIDKKYAKFAPKLREGEFSRLPREIEGFYVAKIAENKDFAAVIYATADFSPYTSRFAYTESSTPRFKSVHFILTTYAPNGDIIDELDVATLFTQNFRKTFFINKDLQFYTISNRNEMTTLKEFYQIDKKGAIKRIKEEDSKDKKTEFYF